MLNTQEIKYRAFISYSHQDSAWAGWLHRALENYVVPRRLVGRVTSAGVIPRRLFPVFRDRDELSSSAELGEVINDALRRSQFQIVICSPRSAGSRWVNEEVRYFKSLGREDRVLALIVDGEPGAEARGISGLECFPVSLRHRMQADGSFSGEAIEPIAADARPGAGGRQEALLKLIAGLLDVGYDELVQRERNKRFWNAARWAAGAAALIMALASIWHWDAGQRAESARQARLRNLFNLGREESLNGHPARAATYLGAVLEGGYDSPALRLLLGRTLRSIDAEDGVRVHHDNESGASTAWLPDGTQFVTYWRNIKRWDTKTGALLLTFGDRECSGYVSIVASPDGRRVITHCRDQFSDDPYHTDVYDTQTGRRVFEVTGTVTLMTYGNAFHSMTSDSRLIAVVEADSVGVYGLDDGREVLRLRSPGVTSAGFSLDGREIVTADRDGWIDVWRVDGAARRLHFQTRSRGEVHAFFSPHDALYVLDPHGTFREYNKADGHIVDALGGHTRSVEQVEFSRDGKRLLTHAPDATKIWDVETGADLLSVPCNDCKFSVDASFDASGTRVAARIGRNVAAIWSIDDRRLLAEFEGHSSEITRVGFSPDGQHLLTSGQDGDTQIWRVAALHPDLLHRLPHEASTSPGVTNGTYSGRFSPDGHTVLTAGSDNTARVWDSDSGALLHVLQGHTKLVNHAAFSPDGRWIATGSDDLSARLWDASTGIERFVLPDHNRFVRRVVFSADGSRLLTVAGTEPRIWDTGTGALIARLAGHKAPAIDGRFSADGRRVLTAAADGIARIFDATSGKELQHFVGHEGVVTFVTWTDGEQCVVTAGADGKARVWEAASGKLRAEIVEPLAGAAGFRAGVLSHDGEQVLLAASSGELMLWRWRGRTMRRLAGHTIASYWQEFSADDRLAVSASNDNTTRVWDIDSGTSLATFNIETRRGSTWSAAFDPAAERVLTTGDSTPPTAELWDVTRDTRSSQTITQLLRCRSPWKVDGEMLVAHAPEPGACSSTSGGATHE